MAIKKTIRKIIKKFIKLLEQNDIKVEKVFLFGSYSNNKNKKYSDIDIVIISKDFKGNRIKDYLKISPFIVKTDIRLSPIPYIPEDFNEFDPLATEILQNGKELKIS